MEAPVPGGIQVYYTDHPNEWFAEEKCIPVRLFSLPDIPAYATNNAHMFYLVFPDLEKRTDFIAKMKQRNILCVFHYLSLHSSAFYRDRYDGRSLPNCDRYAECLVRLPSYYELNPEPVLRGVNLGFG